MNPPAGHDDGDTTTEGLPTPAELAALVVASDERYFSLGAERRELPGLDLHVHHGFTDVAAGLVAVGATAAPVTASEVATGLRTAIADLGVPAVRAYVTKGTPAQRWEVERGLRRVAEHRGTEVAMAVPADRIGPPHRPLRLEPITTDVGWERKRAVHASDVRAPDGHDVDPDRWVAFERAKADSPSFRPMLLTEEGEVLATVALLVSDDLVRIKNLVIAPGRRHQGLAGELVRTVAEAHPSAVLGLMAADGSFGYRAYLAAGLREVGRIDEWLVPAAAP